VVEIGNYTISDCIFSSNHKGKFEIIFTPPVSLSSLPNLLQIDTYSKKLWYYYLVQFLNHIKFLPVYNQTIPNKLENLVKSIAFAMQILSATLRHTLIGSSHLSDRNFEASINAKLSQ
jgi:hypothetical protein